MTLEQFLRRHKGVSHRMLVRLKRIPGGICCNGAPIRTIDPVRYGDEIVLTDRENASALQPAAVSVPVLDETDSYIIYNKPAHMPVHPSQGHHSDTLGNVFAAQFPELPFRPVYRLDRDTSGICLAAKSAYAAKQLQGSTRKTYLALVCGILTESGTVDAPIGRHPTDRKRMAVTQKNARRAVTHWSVIARYNGYTHIRCELETGRTHQIRVHMAHIGHPLLGDLVYGHKRPEKGLSGQCLHARALRFLHPRTGELVTFTCPLPDYFQDVLARLGPPVG